LALPAREALFDLAVRAVVVVHRTLEQEFRLRLRRHRVERFKVMLRQDVRRRGLGLALEAEHAGNFVARGAARAGEQDDRQGAHEPREAEPRALGARGLPVHGAGEAATLMPRLAAPKSEGPRLRPRTNGATAHSDYEKRTPCAIAP